MDVRTAIRSRRSTRRYASQPVAEEVLEHLLRFADGAQHLVRPGVRLAWVNGEERVGMVLARYAGMYGLVQGAPHLIVGLLPGDTDLYRLDLGYVLEQVVLEATRHGLATCWMTGSYRPEQAARQVETAVGEVVAAVVSLGYPRHDDLARLHDGMIRRLVSAHRRLPLEELVFAGQWGRPWSPEGSEPTLVEVLECARLAPSARNRQPWRFVVAERALHLALVEPAPIDGGIVMAHVLLAAAELGWEGQWAVCWRDAALSQALNLPPTATLVGTFYR